MRRRLCALGCALALLPVPAGHAEPTAWLPTYTSGWFSGEVSMFRDGTAYLAVNTWTGRLLVESRDFGRTWSAMPGTPAGAGLPRYGTTKIGFATHLTQCSPTSCHRDVYRTIDGGRSWLRATSVPDPGPAYIQFGSTHWAVAPGGRTLVVPASRRPRDPLCTMGMRWGKKEHQVFVSNDGARSWRHYTLPFRSEGVTSIVALFDDRHGAMAVSEIDADPRACYLEGATYRGAVWVTHDGGRTWRRTAARCENWCTSIAMPAPDRIVVGSFGNTIEASEDGGRTFRRTRLPPGTTFNHSVMDLAFPEPSVGWAITQDAGIWRTADGGRTWAHEPSTADGLQIGFTNLGAADAAHAVAITPNAVLTRMPMQD